MPFVLQDGPLDWRGSRTEKGHRRYSVDWLVKTTNPLEGPAEAMRTPGLFEVGSEWVVDDDVDLWCWCRPEMAAVRYEPKGGEKGKFFKVTQNFSSEPLDQERCEQGGIEDPLSEPPVVSIGTITYSEEAVRDRFGNLLQSSSFEQFRGPAVEFEFNRTAIHIEMNVAEIDLALVDSMKNSVNDSPIWTYPVRCVKLAKYTAEKKLYGLCYFYWHVTFDFDGYVRVDEDGNLVSGHDRDIADEGTKVLTGYKGSGAGSGCTLTLAVSPGDGSIQTATLVSGGSGYEPTVGAITSWIQLQIIQAGSKDDATVMLRVDSSGVVDQVKRVMGTGHGYSNGAATTQSGSVHVFNNVDGDAPDPDNPQHFERMKDGKAENVRIMLNGKGGPAMSPETCAKLHFEVLPESNFYLLGIPADF